MKITPEQLAALQQQQKKTVQPASGTGFAQALTQEMLADPPAQTASGKSLVTPLLGLDQILQTAMLPQPTEQAIMEKMDSLFSKWENYSQTLGTSQGSLREGYHLLAELRQSIQEVKNDLESKATTAPGLHAMIEELEILATTEEYKFNRGDYLN